MENNENEKNFQELESRKLEKAIAKPVPKDVGGLKKPKK